MASDNTQRILRMTAAALGGADEDAILTEIDGTDEISKPFLYTIKFVTQKKPSEVKGLLKTPVTLEFGIDDGGAGPDRRKLRGYVRRVVRIGSTVADDWTEWQAEVVPAIWFLSLTSDVRIYQDKTLKDIINEKFQEAGFPAPKITATTLASFKFEYLVQYGETDLDFVSRLMEKFGWFYYHDHGESDTKTMISDMNSQTPAWTGPAMTYDSALNAAQMQSYQDDYAVQPGNWKSRDFDYDRFSHVEFAHPTKLAAGAVMGARYGFPTSDHTKVKDDGVAGLYGHGTTLMNVVAERDEARHHLHHGSCTNAYVDTGRRLKLDIGNLDSVEVLVTGVRHKAKDYSHWSSADWGNRADYEFFYQNEFSCQPMSVPFRPLAITPRPYVRGPQTATVTGQGEIDPDSLGRVKVHFHWDLKREFTCRIRVSQGWAGNQFGHIQIPRIGEEVIVDFIDGDPDRPIITGRVYNGKNKVPYGLPANKTQSGIKTRSSPGGGADNFNELRFEDKKGSEQIYLHAEKDLDSVVENNETRKVGTTGTGDRTTTIKNNETHTIGGNKKTDVTGNFDETIKGKETRTVFGDVSETYMAKETRTIMGNVSETIMGSITKTVMQGVTNTILGSLTETVIGGITQVSPAVISVTSAASINHTAPNLLQTTPNFYNTGATNGDAYGFVQSNCGLKIENMGVCIGTVGVKIDNFGVSIANGAVEIKNKSMKAYTYTFAVKTGFTLHS